MITFGREICGDFERASSREWLETNGIGGFASGTISGANTRRYHGILTSATRPPLGRVTMLSKFEETLVIDGKNFDLSANLFPGAVSPKGFEFLKSFRLEPFPIWTFEIEDIEIEKKIFMVHGENTTVCQWSVIGGQQSDISLELKPLFSFVDYHALQHETDSVNMDFDSGKTYVLIKPVEDLPELFINHNAQEIEKTGVWYENFEYAIERERGFDYTEDLFQPFALKFDLTEAAKVLVSAERKFITETENLEKAEIERRENLIKTAAAEDDFTAQLVLAADQFIVSRGAGKTVIAGYPWFSDWGRDTMIALSGLTLSTNRTEIAREILLEFSKHISQGMLPNRFPDVGDKAEYNTVDAMLWYFEAVRAYLEKTDDYDFLRGNLYQKLVNVIIWHLRGTRYKIRLDTDGLLCAGENGSQLTWMDAKVGDEVFTPRVGKPVEIQALWYNALKIMSEFSERFGDTEDKLRYDALANMAKQSFNAVFWNDEEDCLFDFVTNGMRDGSVRPNQIFALSLPNAILDDAEKAQKIIRKVESELLTPVGLRSLSPKDSEYHPIYQGSAFERDSAYHQGTVWAWLIGAFVDARRKFFPDEENRIAEILQGFEKHLTQAGIGQISEIFDGNEPFAPRGCPAQAWSVAEVLRVKRGGKRD